MELVNYSDFEASVPWPERGQSEKAPNKNCELWKAGNVVNMENFGFRGQHRER